MKTMGNHPNEYKVSSLIGLCVGLVTSILMLDNCMHWAFAEMVRFDFGSYSFEGYLLAISIIGIVALVGLVFSAKAAWRSSSLFRAFSAIAVLLNLLAVGFVLLVYFEYFIYPRIYPHH